MTKFLASVTSVEEARIAFECGADLIDCKDPSSGALGALRDETVAAIVKYVAGRRPVSATIGDLPMEPSLICAAVKAKIKTGVDYVKIGMFYSSHRRSLSRHALSREPVSSGPISLDSGVHRNDGLTKVHLEECCAAVQPLATQTSLIAVLFADPNPDLTLLPMVANAGFAGVMLDTANKDGGGLTSHGSYAFLAQFVSNAQKLDLDAGLAGSLKLEDLAPLLRLSPDYLGFRGALCETGRASTIDGEKVERLANAMRDARELGDRTTV